MAATSIDVMWVKSVVTVGGETMYRLQTTCSNPVNITDAALFVYTVSPNAYLQTAMVGDMLQYWPYFPAIRRLGFDTPTSIDSGYIGATVTGQTSGHTGILRGFSSDTKTWYVSPNTTADTFQLDEVVVASGTPPVSATIKTIMGDTRYRKSVATLDFNTPQLAEAAELLQKDRLQHLITDWAKGYGNFEGTDSETIEAT